mmetsp:Transcript_1338/g.3138  ORF Transcript_1338/g.3138 Transcript_1338/m.3138 type:complete len:210 (-) Transcript_1338:177-806(-)
MRRSPRCSTCSRSCPNPCRRQPKRFRTWASRPPASCPLLSRKLARARGGRKRRATWMRNGRRSRRRSPKSKRMHKQPRRLRPCLHEGRGGSQSRRLRLLLQSLRRTGPAQRKPRKQHPQLPTHLRRRRRPACQQSQRCHQRSLQKFLQRSLQRSRQIPAPQPKVRQRTGRRRSSYRPRSRSGTEVFSRSTCGPLTDVRMPQSGSWGSTL